MDHNGRGGGGALVGADGGGCGGGGGPVPFKGLNSGMVWIRQRLSGFQVRPK